MNLSPQSAYEEKYFLLIRVLCVMTTERFSFWQLCTLSWDPSFYTEERSTGHALRDNIFSSFIYMYIISIFLTCRAFWITKCFPSETWWMNCFNFFQKTKKKSKGRILIYMTHISLTWSLMRNQNSSLFNQNIYCIHFAIINQLCVDLYDVNIHLFIGTDTAVSCPTLLISVPCLSA